MSGRPVSVVVPRCGTLRVAVANRLAELEEVRGLALVTTPCRVRQRRGRDRIRRVLRHDGFRGLLAAVGRRFVRGRPTGNPASPDPFDGPAPGVAHFRFDDFHAPESFGKLRALAPDIGVPAGVYILRESVFDVPRPGSVNLHSGEAPENRGSAPAFRELYNGEGEVGITSHRVTDTPDAGEVIRQETFPLDPAPQDDPFEYIPRYRRDVPEPNGVRLPVESVRDSAMGRAQRSSQDMSRARTFRDPEYRDEEEPRRRVRTRRRVSNG